MQFFLLSSLFLGSLVVIQPILNRMIMNEQGLAFVALNNALVLLGLALLFSVLLWLFPQIFPSNINIQAHGLSLGSWRWWYLLPGSIGFLLVILVPLCISKLGALSTILVMLVGQLLTSYLWDLLANQQVWFSSRLLGLGLAIAGAYLSIRPQS